MGGGVHDAQLQRDKRDHVLPELPVGSTVGYRDHVTNKFCVGVVSDRNVRLYTIFMENGTHISRNGIDLKCTSVQFDPKPNSNILPKTRQTVSSDANLKHAPPNPVKTSNVKCTGKPNLTEKGIDVSNNNMYKTCNGCISKPATRLITQM